ncbi:unnamed protein product [Polarella glacialis]|uniref:Uncharacterized protein n=1 Tax=Polarella glacialis TaxID=89957 RepID=A0A813DMG8_POLGL|nr:unnamed protein product [Polarella glacialis]
MKSIIRANVNPSNVPGGFAMSHYAVRGSRNEVAGPRLSSSEEDISISSIQKLCNMTLQQQPQPQPLPQQQQQEEDSNGRLEIHTSTAGTLPRACQTKATTTTTTLNGQRTAVCIQ